MKKRLMLSLVVAVIGALFVGTANAEQDRQKFDPNAIMGRVIITVGDNGTVTSVKIENRRGGSWNVVLDAKGFELAQAANTAVKVEGTVAMQGDEKWVTVTSFEKMKRPEGMGKHHGDPNCPRRGGHRGGNKEAPPKDGD